MDATPPEIDPAVIEEDMDLYGLRCLAGRIGAVLRFDSGVRHSSNPAKMATFDGVLRYDDTSGRENSTIIQHSPPRESNPENLQHVPPWILKYVDDVNVGERHIIKNARS